ncbi:MAG TPA: hypothetical protein VMA74_08975 [Dyella sp.]|uniref:hypothetical protein n=1 Tax=Dyella sp. TaxID=1869338 RepID=UPI002C0E3EA0|nr:hypothetical protein [Dyella sp.]HUB89850.1 hypothetical protein [Dyella sp.]
MKAMRLACRLAATAPFILAFLSTPFSPAIAAPSQDGPVSIPPGQIASVDPPVPRAAGQPCVVELFNSRPWP